MNAAPGCPCDRFVHPWSPVNAPGLDTIAYRVGDFTSFREALLLPPAADADLPAEVELTEWRPGAAGDLAVQLVEWWAYLADILTFYNERALTEALLRTALLPESVRRLIRVLGYRPRPGIGARGTVAALISGPDTITVPRGFPIQSKPGPGQQPQIFEVEADTDVGPPSTVAVVPQPVDKLVRDDGRVLLRGVVRTLQPGEEVLLLKRGWNASDRAFALATVKEARPEKAPGGQSQTAVSFQATPSLPANAKASDYRLLRAPLVTRLYSFAADTVITKEQMHLESLVRQLKVGDPVLFPDGELVSVTGYQETIWYANAASATPQTAPSAPAVPVPIPHSQIDFTVPSGTPDRSGLNGADKRKTVTLRYAWQPAGELIPTPATQFDDKSPDPSLGATALKVDQAVLVEDANGHGARAKITDTGLHLSAPFDKLMAPLRALPNLLPVTRGQTVEREILGSGDARLPGQEFVLQKSPLTYLPSDDSKLGTGYKSTLRVWVDEIEWHEVSSFYGQPRDAKVFVTREDEDNKTHVLTGDGGFGARLSTGVNNVVASYRYGSGVAVPGADALTVVVRPLPRLTAIRNPVPPGGGADPEPADRIRRLAPRSVLTFGRAVSADDYEVIAAAAPGVTRAQAAWVWDAVRQRTLVKVFVGDDAGAVDSARLALAGAGDPNRPVRVEAATPVDMALELTLVFDPDRTPDPVVKAVASALLAPDTGLFSAGKVRVGQSLFASAIHAACLKVPGVLAVHALKFATQQGATKTAPTGFRFDPGEGKFFRLTAERLEVHHVP